MSGPRDRYDSGKRAPREPVSAEGLSYDAQRTPPEKVRRQIQDGCAVHLLCRAFGRIQNNCGDALDRELADTFVHALDDGSLKDTLVFVSSQRAEQLIDRVKRYGRPNLGFAREPETRQVRANSVRARRQAVG